MGSSKAAFHGVFQRRHCAQRRRSLLSFSPPPPGRTSFFTQPPAIGCRARTPRRCFPMGSSKAAFCGILQGRRGGASRWARPRRASTGFCRATETMLPVGLVRGGFLRAFAGPPRRCLPMGSSEAAFCGVFQRRRCAQRRRSLLSFSPPPPGRTSFFTQPPAIGYRARSPKRCSPKGSSEAAFCGIFQWRRCAQRRRSLLSFLPRRTGNGGRALPFRPIGGAPGASSLSSIPSRPDSGCRARTPKRCPLKNSSKAGFCRAAEAMLAEGLV